MISHRPSLNLDAIWLGSAALLGARGDGVRNALDITNSVSLEEVDQQIRDKVGTLWNSEFSMP